MPRGFADVRRRCASRVHSDDDDGSQFVGGGYCDNHLFQAASNLQFDKVEVHDSRSRCAESGHWSALGEIATKVNTIVMLSTAFLYLI